MKTNRRMMKLRRNRFLGLGLMVLAGCTSSTGPEGDGDLTLVPAMQEMTLALGEEQAVEGSVLRVTFGSLLEDSRCPVDAVCVWEGRGRVELGIRAGTGPTVPIEVGTQAEARWADWNGVRVTLLELSPAARMDPAINQSEYRVKVRLEQLLR